MEKRNHIVIDFSGQNYRCDHDEPRIVSRELLTTSSVHTNSELFLGRMEIAQLNLLPDGASTESPREKSSKINLHDNEKHVVFLFLLFGFYRNLISIGFFSKVKSDGISRHLTFTLFSKRRRCFLMSCSAPSTTSNVWLAHLQRFVLSIIIF